MKIAIFHSFLDNIGGAEMVTLHLARALSADVYTTNVDQDKLNRMGFADIKPKSIGRVPKSSPWRQQLASIRFRFLNLSDRYDFFLITGDWAISVAVKHHPNLYYCHSPIRELWDAFGFVRAEMVKGWQRPIFDFWVWLNRRLNRAHVASADRIVCNSRNTQARLKKYLGREAMVINPPVETVKFFYRQNGDYWLSVNRLINPKRVEIQLAAFARRPRAKLIIVGSYESSAHFLRYVEKIKQEKPPNVEIRSGISQTELINLYADCRGFITTAYDEDFGLTAVEAMAAGKPVIAPAEGGYLETVLDGVTGRLIGDLDSAKLATAIDEVGGDPARYRNACQARADEFDLARFVVKIKQEINL
ncbi:MAG: mannosyl transferase [Candidatus Vogelbacteria bacterium CG10_big_fil_rev_8_21_14_0_10_49_38]|uniref:Mannosyl transferase n=1 Tax=Candidatus Vogelbacteria bacterium CG10_big_fil_rev_8_21_14_0_10_49_38 TaxID=1975043 RepID=A0A2H0RHN9_9BACT|nr:MAG: hypothetical protein BK006_01950 [bacterium CG10_49_38]PIR46013.1 MAG: mannosyl transferase [Candidatus Vogelbacteria bacterium CG10_big_fil_rev_8_21_14_0_10_49_38]